MMEATCKCGEPLTVANAVFFTDTGKRRKVPVCETCHRREVRQIGRVNETAFRRFGRSPVRAQILYDGEGGAIRY